MGHEFIGVVEAVGSEVETTSPDASSTARDPLKTCRRATAR
jgi:threonine dehydrogenase-like Zn-dependent dehydrogenase